MINRIFEAGNVLFYLTIMVLAAAAAIYMFPPMARDRVADWAQAIFAGGAIFAAIWLATRENRYRRDQAKVRAQLAAAGLCYRFMRVQMNVIGVQQQLADMPKNRFKRDYKSCQERISRDPFWTMEELVPLIDLPNGCAIKLAAALDRLHVAETLYSRAHDNPKVLEDPDLFLSTMQSATQEVLTLLELGIAECQIAIENLT